ncbi:HlyD family type I secretion periplasmic adaptor subunit [Paracoccaceae bacterium Fryx2]|nr:HlyD family type I secretion periplasmic adaptor subunit [Paracoccaceae bacterium Fryx2]
MLTLVALVGGFGIWSVATSIAGAIVASGQLEVEQSRQIVQHPDGGVVESISVSDGDVVAAGDLLLRLDGGLLRSELSIVEGQLFEILARRSRLTAERDDAAEITVTGELAEISATRPEIAEQIDGQIRLFAARQETLANQTNQLGKRRNQIDSQITGIDAQNAALATQLDLIRQELADQQALLDRGLTQSSRVLNLQREEARLRGQVGELNASRAQAEGRITEIEIEILRLSSTRREEAITQLRDIGYRELELAERRRALTERILRLDIRAPVSGIVLGMQVTTPRSVLRPADPVLYLIPQDRPLVIVAQVPPNDIDQVHVGQAAKLVFSAFSTRTTPELDGQVAKVSADALTDTASNLSFYRAEIVLDPGEMEKLEGLALIPGMPVEVFMQTDARTPLAFLLKPFTDYFTRAFRES